MITNGYITREEFISRQGAPDATTYPRIDKHIERASRDIDVLCGRQFFTFTGTKDFTVVDGRYMVFDDLVSPTSIYLDLSGQRTYDTLLQTTDYELEPYNCRQENPPRPYTALRLRPYTSAWLPNWYHKGVRITGQWGFSDQTVQKTTVAAGGIDASSTTLNVAAGTGSSIEVGHILLVGTEQMIADGIAIDAVTVRRGVNGTTAASHTAATPVSVYDFGPIGEACGLLAQRLYMRAAAPLGVQNANMFGTTLAKAPPDPEFNAIIDLFRRLV
jgi:hypothetical protein